MKNKLKIYLVLLMVASTLASCDKELSALPDNEKVDANVIIDQATAQIALNGVYYSFANATQANTGWQDHQVKPGMLAGYLAYGFSVFPEEENKNATLTSLFWDESYILLNSANGFLKGINGLADNKFSGNRKKEMIAEARFLRAYAHFRLLTFYGEWYKPESPFGVLLRTELSALGNIQKARSTVKESYDLILSDLDDVIANGPAANPNHYVSKWAGMALKLRVLTNRGLSTDHASVISLADNLIQNGPYQLEPNAQDIFRKNGLASKEVILGVKPQAAQEMAGISKSRDYLPGGSFLFAASPALRNLLANDPRQTWVVGELNSRSNRESYFFTKYITAGMAPSVVSETDYALRLTETYLLKAEAIVRSGGNLAEARTALHEVQARAGITASANSAAYLAVENAQTPQAMLMEVYKETVKSLVGEDGMEWMALLRLPFETVKTLKPTIVNQTQYILPVPRTEFLYNPVFGLQNPGYTAN
ncbi:RagB/SusD family nutrient uptake outer membrane protein [Pedobacter deserti]|uniref:RagB/SusD family nutrient uptake outer membrane protein n=1 Tax=Pedobacter deserti TaxID=2817382 RepID=UPI0021093E3A|nr:RagB/SusD family nutrient uptake outer membrane protein [Pedobacter sp. SYSU D00382]